MIASTAIWLAPISQGWAELTELDWRVDGDKAITHDTRTGLDWLDLTESVGRSFNDVSNNLNRGGDFECFRHATFDEVYGLLTSVGWPVIASNLFDPAAYQPLSKLQSLVGITIDRGFILESHGTTANIVSGVRDGVSIYVDPIHFAGLTQRGGGWDDDVAEDIVGHWLVRTECVDEEFPWEFFMPAIQSNIKRKSQISQ